MLRYVGTCQYEIRANLNYEMDTATNYEAVRFDVKKKLGPILMSQPNTNIRLDRRYVVERIVIVFLVMTSVMM